MSNLLAEYQLVSVPDNSLITLHDEGNDNESASKTGEGIEQAGNTIAASTGDKLYISCVQDLISVLVRVEVWNEVPETDEQRSVQDTSVVTMPLNCPTGQLALGSPTGEFIAVELQPGSGTYAIVVSHAGRTEADRYRHDLLNQIDSLNDDELEEAENRYAGIEQYTIRTWRTGPLPADAETLFRHPGPPLLSQRRTRDDCEIAPAAPEVLTESAAVHA